MKTNENETEIYLYFTETRTVSERYPGPDDPGDYNEYYITIYIKGLYKEKQTFNSKEFVDCKHFIVPKQALNEKGLFVVYVRYTDGDTFSRTSGYVEFITCCKHENDARKICDSIKNKTFQEHQFQVWNGYFASCESVDYEFFNFKD